MTGGVAGPWSWVFFGAHTRSSAANIYSEDVGEVDLVDVAVRINGTAPSGVPVYAGTSHAIEVDFAEVTAPYGVMGTGILTLLSDGVTEAEARAPFPGKNPQPGVTVLESGSDNTVQIALKRGTAGEIGRAHV